MFDKTKDRPLAGNSLKHPSLHGESQAKPQEPLKHRGPDSGRDAHEVGFEGALANWIMSHRSGWHKNRHPDGPLNRLSAP